MASSSARSAYASARHPDVRSDNLEPSEPQLDTEWIEELRMRIKEAKASMVAEAERTLQDRRMEGSEDEVAWNRLAEEHERSLKNIEELMLAQYHEEINRERQERRWAAGIQVDSEWSEALIKEQQAILNTIRKSKEGEQEETSSENVAGLSKSFASTRISGTWRAPNVESGQHSARPSSPLHYRVRNVVGEYPSPSISTPAALPGPSSLPNANTTGRVVPLGSSRSGQHAVLSDESQSRSNSPRIFYAGHEIWRPPMSPVDRAMTPGGRSQQSTMRATPPSSSSHWYQDSGRYTAQGYRSSTPSTGPVVHSPRSSGVSDSLRGRSLPHILSAPVSHKATMRGKRSSAKDSPFGRHESPETYSGQVPARNSLSRGASFPSSQTLEERRSGCSGSSADHSPPGTPVNHEIWYPQPESAARPLAKLSSHYDASQKAPNMGPSGVMAPLISSSLCREYQLDTRSSSCPPDDVSRVRRLPEVQGPRSAGISQPPIDRSERPFDTRSRPIPIPRPRAPVQWQDGAKNSSPVYHARPVPRRYVDIIPPYDSDEYSTHREREAS